MSVPKILIYVYIFYCHVSGSLVSWDLQTNRTKKYFFGKTSIFSLALHPEESKYLHLCTDFYCLNSHLNGYFENRRPSYGFDLGSRFGVVAGSSVIKLFSKLIEIDIFFYVWCPFGVIFYE